MTIKGGTGEEREYTSNRQYNNNNKTHAKRERDSTAHCTISMYLCVIIMLLISYIISLVSVYINPPLSTSDELHQLLVLLPSLMSAGTFCMYLVLCSLFNFVYVFILSSNAMNVHLHYNINHSYCRCGSECCIIINTL